MHPIAREEVTVPEQTNVPETPKPPPETSEPTTSPGPEAGEPEPLRQEETALVSAEPDVIEGEVVEIEPEEETRPFPPKQKPYWLLLPFAIVLCLLFLAGSSLLPLLTPSATITILPVEKTVSITTAIQVQGRLLPALTLSQNRTVPATGKRHQDATQAHGTITFYNGLLSRQTIPPGTILTGADGVQISTDQAAYIPPASNTTPPTFGQVTVAAHAVQPGAQGNILPYDLNGSCCTTSILVKNTSAFTGGQNARDYTVVTGRDIINGSTSLKTALLKSEQGALNAQIIPSEALITPPCNPTVSSNQKVGDEAKQVTVMVSEICSGIAYDARTLHANDTQVITRIARQRFGTGYTLLGDVTDSVVHATISDPKRGIATFTVKIDATSIYQLSPSEKQHLANMIAGKSKTTAIHILLSVPGIQAASIRFTRGDTLPQDPQAIRILVLYQAM